MTKKKALHVLITHAAKSAAGAGQGFRSGDIDKDRIVVREAIVKLYKDAYGCEVDGNVLFNMGL